MSRLALTFASCRYDRLEAIRDGDVAVEGVDLNCITLKSGRDVFDRMVGGREFDVAELSASEYVSLHGAGDCPFVAIPVFPSRVFRHGYIFVNARAGIRTPKDLEGRRVGLPLYTHGIPHAPPLLRPVDIEHNDSGEPLGELLARGDIDALIGSRKPDSLGRHPDVVRLFPDYRALERKLYETTKIFPIMHLIAMRRDLHERHRWVATSFYKALIESKRRALTRMRYGGSLAYMLPWLMAEIEEIDAVFAGDAWPYGIEANRPTLQALVQYMFEQHFIPKPIPIEDLFIPLPGEPAT
jgi:4,5-dihydroxyphthalate decarboxylase